MDDEGNKNLTYSEIDINILLNELVHKTQYIKYVINILYKNYTTFNRTEVLLSAYNETENLIINNKNIIEVINFLDLTLRDLDKILAQCISLSNLWALYL